MRTYSITVAKASLSRLVEKAVMGEAFLITKFGRPVVKVVPYDLPAAIAKKRFGFMAGQIKIPADFNRMGSRKIRRLFEAEK